MKVSLLIFCSIVFTLPQNGQAQDDLTFKFTSGIYRTYPAISVTRTAMLEAETLSDFNKHFKESWVKEYESVKITTLHDGSPRTTIAEDGTMTDEQRKNMNTADNGTDITVIVRYLPDNNLKQNDIKTFDFSFIIEPDHEASFPGGEQALERYLAQHIFDQVTFNKFRQYHLSAVKFTVDQDGRVVDAAVAESSGDSETDNILLKAACNMPIWKPASYANGQKVKQDFMLTAGDINSCVVNLINIRYDLEAHND